MHTCIVTYNSRQSIIVQFKEAQDSSACTIPSQLQNSAMSSVVYNILLVAVAIASIAQLTTSTKYRVGEPSGSWDLSTNLTEWVASKTFYTGDVLQFTYNPSAHEVLEVTKSNYDSCTTSGPISTDTSGNIVVTLNAAGTRYFVCGFTGHCAAGMKVQIDVSLSSSSPAPAIGGPTPPSSVPSVLYPKFLVKGFVVIC